MKDVNKEKKKKNRKIALWVSSGVHVALLVLFLFLVAWKEPHPPNPGIPGVELSMGATMGGAEHEAEEEQETEGPDETNVEESAAESEPTETEAPEPEASDAAAENVDAAETESPHQVSESENTSENPETETAEASSSEAESPATETEEESQSAGDGPDERATMTNEGEEPGEVDERAVFPGDGGAGGQGGLDISGWQWADDISACPANEEGKIRFKITVSEHGIIESANAVEYSVNPSVVNCYKQKLLEEGRLIKIGSSASRNYTGYYTIILDAN